MEKPPMLGMEKCRKCGRNFMLERIAKHENVCMNQKKVKVKRFQPLPPKKKKKETKKPAKWRQQHS